MKKFFKSMICALVLGAAVAPAAAQTISLADGSPITFSKSVYINKTTGEKMKEIFWRLSQNGTEVVSSSVASTSATGTTSLTLKLDDFLKNAYNAGTLTEGPIQITLYKYINPDDAEVEIDPVTYTYILSETPAVTGWSPKEGSAITTSTNFYGVFNQSVTGAKARVYQNSTELTPGETDFPPTMAPGNAYAGWKKAAMETYLKEWDFQPGEFTVDIVSITFKSSLDGEVKTVDGQVFATGKFYYGGIPGKLDKEEGLENGLLSWYPADSEDGILKLTFTKALDETKVKTSLSYGNMEDPNAPSASRVIPFTLENDGMTLVMDFRGELRNVETLVGPNAIFYDDNGNTTDPPSRIVVAASNLYATDGTRMQVTVVASDGIAHTIEGTYSKGFDYTDISLPNPKITSALFFDEANSTVTSQSIKENNTHIRLTVANTSSFSSTDVLYAYENGDSFTASATVNDGEIEAALPAEVKANGINGLSVTLANTVYTKEDGVNHVVTPYSFDGVVIIDEVSSVAQILQKDPETEVIFNIPVSGLKVTGNIMEGFFIFAEDDTAGMQIDSENGLDYQTGDLLSGKLEGKYMGEGYFMVTSNDEVSVGTVDVSEGLDVESLGFLTTNPMFANRLVTITNSSESVISVEDNVISVSQTTQDEEGEDMLLQLVVLTGNPDWMADYQAPAKVKKVTGIYYSSAWMGSMLIPRGDADIVADDNTAVENIEEAANGAFNAYSVQGMKLKAGSQNDLLPGLYIINGKKVLVKDK